MFTGSLVALVTPMTDAGELDLSALGALLDWHLEAGTDGIVLLGTTGESPTINASERKLLIESCAAHLQGRIPLIVGSGTNDTAHSIALTRQAMELGADASLLVTPYYNKPSDTGLLAHYQAIAEAVPIPQILYNVPGRTGCDLSLEVVRQLAQLPNIVALKDATADLARVPDLAAVADAFDVLSGDDATALQLVAAGGRGVISVTANVAPLAVKQMMDFALAGNIDAASGLQSKLEALNEVLFIQSNPIPVKWLLQRMGKINGALRLPLTTLEQGLQGRVEQAAKQAGISL